MEARGYSESGDLEGPRSCLRQCGFVVVVVAEGGSMVQLLTLASSYVVLGLG